VREFVAVDVGAGPGSAPEHLTLRFLGEVAPARNDRLIGLLAAVARRRPPFRIRFEGIGAFPSPARPRVVWVGVTVGREAITSLAEEVRRALAPEVGPETAPFVPHLTLFRVRSTSDRAAAADLLAGARPAPPPRELRVDRFALKESVLGARGAVHRTLAEFPLTGPEPPGP
jgi:RNA 2',3'-cyclic 3'-phosphodiesterase